MAGRGLVIAAEHAILGIDLGITSVVVALLDEDGRTRVVPSSDGEDATPTCVHVFDADGVVVGQEALKMLALEPRNVLEDVTWRLGEAGWGPTLHDRTWTAQALVAEVLRKLRADVESVRGIDVARAVVAVPAWFDSARRAAAVEAAKLAGLEVLSLVNQPLAAALGAGVHKLPRDGPVVVFDLGGRDLEVTVLHKQGEALTVKASQARYDLCVRAFELKVRQFLVERYRADARGAAGTEDEVLAQQVVDAARGALATLLTRDVAAMRLTSGGVQSRVSLDRATFGVRTAPLLVSAVGLIDQVLADVGSRADDVVACVPVGRGSRLPNVLAVLRERFGDRLEEPADPHLCIGRGAALLGVLRHERRHPGLHALARTERGELPARPLAQRAAEAPSPAEPTPSEPARRGAVIGLADGGHVADAVRARDATTRDLGLIALDGDRREVVVRVIPRGTPLPCEVRGRFTYAYEGMTGVRFEVTEGDGARREEVSVVGAIELRGLPPRTVGTPIEVLFRYQLDQILQLQVVDVETGRRSDAEVHLRGEQRSSDPASSRS